MIVPDDEELKGKAKIIKKRNEKRQKERNTKPDKHP